MNKTDLINNIAAKSGLTKKDVETVLNGFLGEVTEALSSGEKVQLIGFGTFKSAKRAARTGKNPRTGQALKIPATTLPKFVPGAKFKAVVDPKAAKRKADKAGK